MATRSALPPREDFRVANFEFRSLSERELARLWKDQTFPPEALVTGEGEKLRVIYRGRGSSGPGPDFRDALIAAPAGLLQGDVELHVRSSDFQRHGHQRDPAYAGVVLHLVFWDDERHRTVLPGGGTAPVAALAGWVEGRAKEIARWLERPALWREPCFSALTRDGPIEVAATLDRLGDMRFRQKVAALVPAIARRGNEEALWQSLLEALAFGPDREAFRLLAQRVCWAALREPLRSLPHADRAGAALCALKPAFAGPPLPLPAVRRPANGPARRLEGAARLAARFAEKGLAVSLLDAFEKQDPPNDRKRTRTKNAKKEETKSENPESLGPSDRRSPRLRVSNVGLRSSEGPRPQQRAAASLVRALTVPGLVGRGRAIEIVANAVLPWLAAIGPEERVRRAEAIFACLPLPARYGAVRHLHEAVSRGPEETTKRKTKSGSNDFRLSTFAFRGTAGVAGGPGVHVDFRRQQGMLYLLKQYCTQGGCGRCPLS